MKEAGSRTSELNSLGERAGIGTVVKQLLELGEVDWKGITRRRAVLHQAAEGGFLAVLELNGHGHLRNPKKQGAQLPLFVQRTARRPEKEFGGFGNRDGLSNTDGSRRGGLKVVETRLVAAFQQ